MRVRQGSPSRLSSSPPAAKPAARASSTRTAWRMVEPASVTGLDRIAGPSRPGLDPSLGPAAGAYPLSENR